MTTGWLLFVVGLSGAVLLVARSRAGAVLALGVSLAGMVLALAWQPLAKPHDAVPRQRLEGRYVGSSACLACHGPEHGSWHRTFHRSMTRVTSPESVMPRLPVRLELDGRPYELSQGADGRYEVVGPDLHAWGALLAEVARQHGSESEASRALSAQVGREVSRVRREMVLVTGSHHYQAFWVEGGSGRELRQLPFVYLLDSALPEQERWLPRRDAFVQPPDATAHIARWNANCVQCHSVAGQPGHSEGLHQGAGSYDSSVVDFGIGCEACHGPGALHVAHYQNPLARYLGRGEPSHIVNPARLDAARSSAVCGQCHSYFLPKSPDEWWESGFSESYRPGQTLDKSRLIVDFAQHREEPQLLSRTLDSVFWPDGTIRVGGREYNGLLRSPCFERAVGKKQMSCVSCHSMHQSDPDDQLAEGMAGNRACTQCHEAFAARTEEHTHHPARSSGSLCYNCHMPRTSYALLKAIRSHRITSPEVRPEDDAAPNACNLCHLDRSLGWTQRWLSRWWDHKEPSEADESTEEDMPASVTWLLSGNAAQRILLADGVAWAPALEISGTTWQAPLLDRLLDDPYAAVRYVAKRSLRRLSEYPGPRSQRALRAWSRRELDALSQRRNDAPITISE